jgi:hypothetical protein
VFDPELAQRAVEEFRLGDRDIRVVLTQMINDHPDRTIPLLLRILLRRDTDPLAKDRNQTRDGSHLTLTKSPSPRTAPNTSAPE